MGGLQPFQIWVIFTGTVAFNDFMPDRINKGVKVLDLHVGDTVHINFNIRQKFDKILMSGKLTEQPVIDTPVF